MSDRLSLSTREREVIRHALGFGEVDRAKTSFRNYYLTSGSGDDYEVWARLERLGLAVSWKARTSKGIYFAAGSKAANAVKKRGESFDEEVAACLVDTDKAIEKKRNGE